MEDIHDGTFGWIRERPAGDLLGFLEESFGLGHERIGLVVMTEIFHRLTLLSTLLVHEIFLPLFCEMLHGGAARARPRRNGQPPEEKGIFLALSPGWTLRPPDGEGYGTQFSPL
ncbi:hypothetical protein [Achromobacter veterisilvae]|uniref:hypothetical protein n=1 Tax=Achromobacter veterisilvae TaxID=2069367 RepID=UPI0013E9E99E|nr:hypothetical protein [Achromobacter veterisilvae]